eukprot:2174980-Pleurochrysis_carterae.AAC.2
MNSAACVSQSCVRFRTRPHPLTPTLSLGAHVRAAPFWMSSISSRVVRRSHELFRQAAATDPAA